MSKDWIDAAREVLDDEKHAQAWPARNALRAPNRIRSYYLYRSYVSGDAVSTSDLDLCLISWGQLTVDEAAVVRQIAQAHSNMLVDRRGPRSRYVVGLAQDGGKSCASRCNW